MLENYKRYAQGVIHQIKSKKYDYTADYVNNSYNTYGDLPKLISHLRLGYIIGVIDRYPTSILDVGYGNGDFLKLCIDAGIESYGTDISGYPVPEGSMFTKWENVFQYNFDVITFFDALEHFEDISFVKDLNCNYVVVSVPWCHYYSDEWFENWKHRRVDIHLHHFNDDGLVKFMDMNGFECISMTNVEDIIRKPVDENPNILTGIFKKS